jgi:preprotein translocase subunit SecE
MADKIKIAVAVLLVAAGVAGFYFLDQSAMILRVAAVLAGLAAGTVVFLLSDVGKQFRGFTQEAVAETKKVVWPTRKETLQTTGVVFAFVVVMAAFLWAVDSGLLWIVKKLLGQS